MALGAMSKLNRENRKIPEDISVIGFDDIEVASQIVPPLTTVSAPANEIASQAFSMLKSLIEGKVPQNQHIALPAELVIRQSSATTRMNPAAS